MVTQALLSFLIEGWTFIWRWLQVTDEFSFWGPVNDWPRWAYCLLLLTFSSPLLFFTRIGISLFRFAYRFILKPAWMLLFLLISVCRKGFANGLQAWRFVWQHVGMTLLDTMLALPFLTIIANTVFYRYGDWSFLLEVVTACLFGFMGSVFLLNRFKFWLEKNQILLGLKAGPPWAWLFPQIRLSSDQHLLSIAPTGSGKNRGLVMPNLLDLPDRSVFVIDPKGENCLVTAGYRQSQGHEILIFNPYGLFADELAARGFDHFQSFNPLANLDPNDLRFASDVDSLAEALIYSTGDKDDSHWTEAARGYVGFLIMYLVAEPTETATLRRLRAIIQGGHEALIDVLARAEFSHLTVVRESVGRWKIANNEVLGVISTAETQTKMFKDEAICVALDGGGFDFGDMKRRPMSVYLVLPGDYLQERARYLRLILNVAMAQFMRSSKGRYQVLMVLDEFANVGKLAMIKQGFGLIRGYGVTLWPFVQNLTQLLKLYPDDWETFLANTGAVTVAGVNDNATADYFIKRAGKTWIRQTSQSRNTQRGAFSLLHHGESTGETIREELCKGFEVQWYENVR